MGNRNWPDTVFTFYQCMASAPVLEKPRRASASPGRATVKSAAPVAWLPVLCVALGLVALHALAITRYGYFRDELYYIACARRFDWGFVDQPPLSVGLLKLVAEPLGYPLWLVRLPAILCGALASMVAAFTARELGGKAMAQTLAATLVAVTPTYLVVTHLYSMNSLDVLFWAVSAWVWVALGKDKRAALWLVLGAVVGLALLNKLSGLWLLAGLGVATLLTDRRKDLANAEPWVGIGLALAGLVPYVVWQTQNGWVTAEFLQNAMKLKLLPISGWMFLLRELAVMNPIAWPVWLTGLFVALSNPKWRGMALVWLTVLAILLINGRARENYLSPAYAFLFAPGAIQFEDWAGKASGWLKAYVGALVVSAAAIACIVTPLLPQEQAAAGISWLKSLSPTQVPSSEVGAKNNLEGLADMNGWPEMAREVERVWLSLPTEERRRAVVLCNNYGEASAIDLLKKHPEMKVVGRHNNWWLWGPGEWDGSVAILVGEAPPSVRSSFRSVTPVKRLALEWAVPEEATAEVIVVRGLRVPVRTFWSSIKRIE